jgi:hypothetical protein
MAKLSYGTLIKDIRGKIGGVVFSQWKGIPFARLKPTTFRYPWESELNSACRTSVDRLVKAWRDNLSQTQRDAWETYATYLATLTTVYDKLPGRKDIGGTMSGYNAFILTNLLSFSVGYSAIIEDNPSAEVDPIAPTLVDFTFEAGPPRNLVIEFTYDEVPVPETFVRLWLRGKRYAHLLLAKYQDATDETDIEVDAMNFAQGSTLDLPADIYQAQMDAVNQFGRFSPPSVIKTLQVT